MMGGFVDRSSVSEISKIIAQCKNNFGDFASLLSSRVMSDKNSQFSPMTNNALLSLKPRISHERPQDETEKKKRNKLYRGCLIKEEGGRVSGPFVPE